MGMSDLERAKSLDQEAYLLWRERGQLVDMASSEFGCQVSTGRWSYAIAVWFSILRVSF